MSEESREIIRHLMDLKEGVGGLSAEVHATNSHLESVSKKADGIRTDLSEHERDIEAHGQKAMRRGISDLWGWICAVAAIASALYTIYKKGP